MLSDAELAKAINAELDDIASEAIMRGDNKTPAWQPEIDSHAVLRVCLRIEEEIGVTISEDCVPMGGFPDRAVCVAVMMAEAKKAMSKTKDVDTEVEVI
tara:strand:- start:5161 stop:5457 length:297 start_codon:yes stop_codon:yes gene_type:complete